MTARLGALALLLVAFAVAARGEDALDRWLARQGEVHAWTAEFRQTRALAVLKEPLVARGHVWFAEPNRFRWELGQPPQTVAIRGAKELVVLYPRLRRADRLTLDGNRGPMRDALALLEAGFPRRRADLEERFVIRSLAESGPDLWRLVLQPRSAEARRLMESITLEFAVAESGPRNTELRFADGTVLRNDFSQPQANPALADDWFATTIPGDFKVTAVP